MWTSHTFSLPELLLLLSLEWLLFLLFLRSLLSYPGRGSLTLPDDAARMSLWRCLASFLASFLSVLRWSLSSVMALRLPGRGLGCLGSLGAVILLPLFAVSPSGPAAAACWARRSFFWTRSAARSLRRFFMRSIMFGCSDLASSLTSGSSTSGTTAGGGVAAEANSSHSSNSKGVVSSTLRSRLDESAAAAVGFSSTPFTSSDGTAGSAVVGAEPSADPSASCRFSFFSFRIVLRLRPCLTISSRFTFVFFSMTSIDFSPRSRRLRCWSRCRVSTLPRMD